MTTGKGVIEIEFKLTEFYRPEFKLKDISKIWIKQAMKHHKNNVSTTARSLGISRATLYRKLGEMGYTQYEQV